MGGSFNPPHEGHLIVALTALKRLGLEQVWWTVTPGNPLKNHEGLPSQTERMAKCRELTGKNPRMRITGFEAELGSPFTAVTLSFLKRRFPRTQFVWLMGADNLASLHRWQDWRGIAGAVPVAVVDRPAWRYRALASPAGHFLARRRRPERSGRALLASKPPAWTFLTSKLSKQSSTALRTATKKC